MDLIQAIQANDLPEVQRQFQAGAELEQRASNGHTPLMLAAGLGRLEILEMLLQKGARPEATDGDHPRPNLKPMVQFGGKSLLGDEILGHTALFCAARHGHAPLITRLVQAGADPNRRDFLDQTPLIWAAESGDGETVRALLQCGARPDGAAILAALEENHLDCARALLDGGCLPDQKILVQAAYQADGPLLQQMLTLKPKLKPGKALAPVCYAMRKVPADQAPPGRWTTIFNEHGVFKSINQPEDKILEAVEVLLQAGAPVNEISSVGPALYVAAAQGLPRVVQRLLQAGADPNIRHNDSTPGQTAQLMGHTEVVKLLGGSPEAEPPAEPKAEPKPKAPKTLKQPSFKNLPDLSELEETCGSPSTQPEYLRGGLEIHLKNPVDLLELQRQWLPRGVYLFHPGEKTSLVAIPADHWRPAIALMQTNGANCDIHPGDVLKCLQDLEKTQPFELTTITHDRLEGIFQTPIANPKQLAKKMYKFCPDLVDQGCGTLKILAEELQKTPAQLYFWWD